MNTNDRMSARVSRVIFVSLLAFSAAAVALAGQDSTIFSYDGQDLIRKHTTLVTEDGKSAVNTKLDRNSPAYKALVNKRSYTGELTLFGKKCNASYAPLTDKDGGLTGALFVCITE